LDASGRRRLLKILHIDPEKNWGGGEAQVVGLLQYLIDQGHDNHLLAHPHGQLWQRAKTLRLQLSPIEAANDLAPMAAWMIRRLVREREYDIVHLHTKRAHALSAWFSGSRRGTKFVVTRRMDYPEKKNARTHWLYNRSVDGVVAISQNIASLLRDAGVDRKKIRLIHSGIEAARFRADAITRGKTDGRPVIGTLAILEPRKGVRFLLEAAARVKASGIEAEYRIAGSGPLLEELKKLAADLGLAQTVHFVGFVADTAGFLAELDIFVMPSLYEGLGVSALEAMGAGKPVIATRVGGLTESVIDGVTGIIVPPQDAAALAAAIARLVKDRSTALEMGRRGAARVSESFTIERMARANEAFYYELLGAAS